MNISNVVAPQDGPWSSAFNKLDPEPRETLKGLVKEIRGDILTAVLKEAGEQEEALFAEAMESSVSKIVSTYGTQPWVPSLPWDRRISEKELSTLIEVHIW